MIARTWVVHALMSSLGCLGARLRDAGEGFNDGVQVVMERFRCGGFRTIDRLNLEVDRNALGGQDDDYGRQPSAGENGVEDAQDAHMPVVANGNPQREGRAGGQRDLGKDQPVRRIRIFSQHLPEEEAGTLRCGRHGRPHAPLM
jgi:hypothetical protein